jgi:hypothetical protein
VDKFSKSEATGMDTDVGASVGKSGLNAKTLDNYLLEMSVRAKVLEEKNAL